MNQEALLRARAYAHRCSSSLGRGAPREVRDELRSDMDLEIVTMLPRYAATRGSLESFFALRFRGIALDRQRREQRRRRYRSDADVHALTSSAAVEADAITTERRALVRDAIEKLPEHARRALWLRWFEDLSWDEIARACERGAATVRRWHDEALRALREALSARLTDDIKPQPQPLPRALGC
jgi:RNA polymerase sigma factor (sigma-70 family)